MTQSWMLSNRAGFQDFIRRTFFDAYDTTQFPQQQFVQDYLQSNSPYRGLLFYHGLGTGKTRAAINTIERLMDDKDPILLTPASIKTTFVQQILRHSQKGFQLEQYWTAETVDNKYRQRTLNATYEKIVKKHKRVWHGDPLKKSNFRDLTDDERGEIEEQLTALIRDTFNMENHNGINGQKQVDALRDTYQERGKSTPFDDKLIVIDEAHEFARPVANGSTFKTQIYEDIMKASNIKIVLMTGTPIANNPFEFAVLCNLVYGRVNIHKIQLHPTTNEDIHTLLKEIEKDPHVDTIKHDIDTSYNETALCVLTPYGFRTDPNNEGYVIRDESYTDDTDVLKRVRSKLEHSRLITSKTKWSPPYKETLFPAFEYEFNDWFMNDKGFLKNEDIFMRRLLGKVSYYKRSDDDVAQGTPVQHHLEIVYVHLSDTQLQQYKEVRNEEVERLKRQAKKGQEAQDFRAQSLQVCNFVYPSEALVKDESRDKSYGVPSKLSDDSLKLDSLDTYSPKYKRIIEKITNGTGLDLIYSYFRHKVGVELLTRILDVNGWTRVRALKDSTGRRNLSYESSPKPKYIVYEEGDEDEFTELKKIYNNELDSLDDHLRKQCEDLKQNPKSKDSGNEHGNLIKVLFITQKGAAGINLRNVRRVHISEPPWIETNIQQIIGRAIRTQSHIDLPPNEQNVQPYIYLSTVANDKAFDATVKERDGNRTSDELIYEKAQLKEQAIQSFLDAIRRSAVDCPLYGDADCYRVPANMKANDYIMSVFFDEEKLSHKETKESSITSVAVQFHEGREPTYYLYEPQYGTLYSYEAYQQFGTFEAVGTLSYDDNDKKYHVHLL